ncbi:MAG: methyltransferase domain-containing protein, partial [Actinomycetospora chiangmaiensis]|nr:methyltransferase domain-containing protein [Actinomycetospora chiangmaiensis]
FPFTRRIAQRNTRALFDLCAGFVYAQVLTSCIRLRVIEILAEGPLGLDALSRRLALPPERARVLLRAACSLDLLRVLPGERFALADLGAATLGNPGIAAMVEHHALLYADLADPVALLRGEAGRTRLSTYWPYAEGGAVQAGEAARYGALMGTSQAMIAGDILDACSLSDVRHWLDIGGGEGAFIEAAAARLPDGRLTLFDLPAVAERARTRLERVGLGGRVACVGGDFHAGLPAGADTISLVRVVHDHDDAPAQSLLRAVHAALPPGGRLILAEPMAGTSGAEPVGDAYFGFYLMAMGSGRPRTADELSAMLRQAGFTTIGERKTRRPLLVRVLMAHKSGTGTSS